MRLSSHRFSPPSEVLEIADALETGGFQAWAVGGALRDEILGHPRDDWDLATDARPEAVRSMFRRTVPLGIEHGTVGVLARTGAMFEVTTFRRDVETDGRHAVIEFADSIEEDLARRDFTINAMAWRPVTDDFVDPWGGQSDMEGRILRAVGDPARRVAEDYLRVLRGVRFAGRYDLTIEPETRVALEQGVDGTATLSAERVREELEKVLAAERPSASLRMYGEIGLLRIWYPEIAAAPDHPRWELDLAAVDQIPASRSLLRLTRWLLSAFVSGAPASGEDADSEEGAERRAAVGRAVLERLRFSNAVVGNACHLLCHYRPLVGPLDSAARIRTWLSEVGAGPAEDLFELHLSYARAANAVETERYLEHARERVQDELRSGPPLSLAELAIGGDDLLAMGVRQGPAIGILLDELHARVLEDPALNDRDELARLARELIELGRLGDEAS